MQCTRRVPRLAAAAPQRDRHSRARGASSEHAVAIKRAPPPSGASVSHIRRPSAGTGVLQYEYIPTHDNLILELRERRSGEYVQQKCRLAHSALSPRWLYGHLYELWNLRPTQGATVIFHSLQRHLPDAQRVGRAVRPKAGSRKEGLPPWGAPWRSRSGGRGEEKRELKSGGGFREHERVGLGAREAVRERASV